MIVVDNNAGKITLIKALTLVLGRDRLVRELTEHDFFGSNPQVVDRVKVVATITDFPADGALIEDAVGWILKADEAAVVTKLADISPQPPTSSADVVAYLKAKKMDTIAYESLAEAISTTPACRARAADLLSGLACACAGDEATQRFVRGVHGLWVFQP